jgi:hypothetical protein
VGRAGWNAPSCSALGSSLGLYDPVRRAEGHVAARARGGRNDDQRGGLGPHKVDARVVDWVAAVGQECADGLGHVHGAAAADGDQEIGAVLLGHFEAVEDFEVLRIGTDPR